MAKHIRFPGQYCYIEESGKVVIPGNSLFIQDNSAMEFQKI